MRPDAARAPRRTSLYERHVALGARMADFGGWQMPVEYPEGGVLREHEAVRTRAGIFDVGHLGTLRVRGTGAAELVDRCLTNDLARIGPGRAQYTLCLDDATGGTVDDVFVYLLSPEEVLLVPNAANNATVAAALRQEAPSGVEVLDEHEQVGLLAVQGPAADDVMAAAGLPHGHPYLSFRPATVEGADALVCRTGYTGERGYEVVLPAGEAPALWERLLTAAHRACQGLPCGLGARDTLRTEMGYALHGHELSLDISPVRARLEWAVGWDKPRFWGREPLLAERRRGPQRVAWGLLAQGKGVPRADLDVRAPDGHLVGRTTSGTFSPTLRVGVALAQLDPSVSEGDPVDVDVRGRRLRCQVVRPPFVTGTSLRG